MTTRLRDRFPPIDYPLALSAIGLVVIGLVTVYSATSHPGAHYGLWERQVWWALVAFGAAWLVASINYRVYDSLAYPTYIVSLVLLVLVLVMGSSAYGAKRWLDLGPLKFQPSEFAKIATVLVLAVRFNKAGNNVRRFRHWFPAALLVLVPFALVVRQPDLGTSLSFPIILIAMVYWAGMPMPALLLGLSPLFNVVLFILVPAPPLWAIALFYGTLLVVLTRVHLRAPRWVVRLFFLFALSANVGVSVATPQIWNSLAEYQRRRIETFLEPGEDPRGAGYQIIQSKIAIGSGGTLGKGYRNGTQTKLEFLPMRHTDFVYSVVGEEFGLLGALSVVILYAVLILRGLRLAVQIEDRFASLMSVGLVTVLFYHIMVNLLMTIGWAPVTGLPLPLLSYGGTALIVNGVEIGLLQGVALRRRKA